MEERVFFQGVEGLFEDISSEKGAVIAHPHPLYGGNMYNNVVEALRKGFLESGFSTLRFNFSGVDKAEDELKAAVSFMRNRLMDGSRIVLAGYSFGAYIASLVGGDELVLVSYPIAFYPPGPLLALKGRVWMICGTRDDIAPLEELRKVYEDMVCEKEMVVLDTDHFFWGLEEEIAKVVKGWMNG